MDLSKLPKMSNTPQRPENEPQEPKSNRDAKDSQSLDRLDMGYAPEVWLSFVIGILLMLWGRNFASFIISKLTGRTFHTGVNWNAGPLAGQEVAYFDLLGFTALTDAGLFLFGAALVLEGLATMLAFSRMKGREVAVGAALAIAAAATAFNLFVTVRLLAVGTIPAVSLLAVAFGGYMCLFQWKLLRALRWKAAPMT